MIKYVLFTVSVVVLCGCSQICQFGRSDSGSGFKCHSIFAEAKPGMTQKEVSNAIGSPSRRQLDVLYRNTTYGEVWVYDSDPPTVLYFKNGILDKVEYQQ